MKIKKGFTLLEMLVVIGIIAILVSLGFASYSTVQKRPETLKRQGGFESCPTGNGTVLFRQWFSIS